MKRDYLLTINREGTFHVTSDQRTDRQCGVQGQGTYKYFCSISANSKHLTPEGYVMENLWTDEYFQKKYSRYFNHIREPYAVSVSSPQPIPSCEQMAMEAIDHFREMFKTHPDLKKVDVRRIYVRIHGSEVSFIEAEWNK